jgi:hypothetical protein
MNTQSKLEKEVRVLRLHAMVSSVALVVLVTVSFARPFCRAAFEEIDVERINVVEKDGTLRMVLSNQERQHPGIVNGKEIPRDGARPPGLIFFNHLGDEMGGLIFGENGGKGHFGSFTFDKVRNDQTIGFRHLEGDDGSYLTGLEMWQQPNIPHDVMTAKIQDARGITDAAARQAALQALRDNNELAAQRLFLGKMRDDATVLAMYDIKGRPRIRMTVAADGTAKLEFLDEAGKVVSSLPAATDSDR